MLVGSRHIVGSYARCGSCLLGYNHRYVIHDTRFGRSSNLSHGVASWRNQQSQLVPVSSRWQYSVWSLADYTTVPLGWYIIPVLVFIAGLVILFNPFDAAELPFIVLGSAFIVYSLTDLIRLFKYRKRNEEIQEAEEVKDDKEEKKIEENKEAK